MDAPLRHRPDAMLLFAARDGAVTSLPRSEFASLLNPGDLVVANDAATLPASLAGVHVSTGQSIEVRLARAMSFESGARRKFQAVIFGEGDFRLPTERRPPPPDLSAGDALVLGTLNAVVPRILDHPRFIEIEFVGTPEAIREGLARHGRPIQYAHVAEPLALWDVWTCIAGPPVAFEAPSAGFILDWALLSRIRQQSAHFATLTHAAGLSSTGDAELDVRFPLDEAYFIPEPTAREIADVKGRGGRTIAIGTSVVRALEHAAAASNGLAPSGKGLATQRIGAGSQLRLVDAVVTGVHEPGDSHFDLLRAFAGGSTLAAIRQRVLADGFRGHEFGDSIFIDARQAH
jgi:S-adenosylmethionine:tRNA ribosyltransferase-isomerase